MNARNIGRLTKMSEEERERQSEEERYKESMSCPTRAEYIFYVSKGWALIINLVILSLHDLT